MRYTPAQVAQICAQAGFRGPALTNAVAVVLAESGGDPQAVNVNRDATRSRDRGLFQINSRWHPEVSDAVAFNPLENARAAYRISNGGRDWSPWTTWKTGAAQVNIPRARLAVAQVGDGTTPDNRTAPGDDGGGFVPGLPDAGDLLPGDPSLGDLGGLGGDAAKDLAGGITDTLDAYRQFAVLAVKTGAWIADPHNWLRVAYVTTGAVGVLIGVAMIARSGAAGDTAKGVGGTVTDAATMAASGGAGAVAKAGKAATAAKAVT